MSIPENSVLVNEAKVLQVRELTPSTYVLRFDKNDMNYKAGQYITLGLPDNYDSREYSIYSAENSPYLEVIIKEIDDGKVSRQLKRVKEGNTVRLDGPFGFFTLEKKFIENSKVLLVASGTGISPFHSYVGSYPELDYTLLHGIRYHDEAYEREFYEKGRYIACTSGDDKGDYAGRVTDYIKENPLDKDTQVYLCGNCNMIYDVFDILNNQGFPTSQIHTEVYF